MSIILELLIGFGFQVKEKTKMRFVLYLKLIIRILKNIPKVEVIINTILFQMNKINKKAVLNYYPVSMIISATKRCNFTCSFCFVEEYMGKSAGTSGDLSFEQLEEIRKTKYYKKALRVGFLGGEPFMNKNIFEYLNILHKDKKITTVVTNSSLLKGENLNKLLASNLDVLGLSLYDNNYEDVTRVVKAINQKKLYWMQTIISADNLSKMEKVLEFATNIGCENLIFDNYYPMNKEDEVKIVKVDNLEYKKLKKELSEKYSRKINITWVALVDLEESVGKSKRACELPFSYIQLDNVGNIGPCCVRAPEESFGNVFDANGWNNKKMQSLRRNLSDLSEPINDTCKNCQCLSVDLYNI